MNDRILHEASKQWRCVWITDQCSIRENRAKKQSNPDPFWQNEDIYPHMPMHSLLERQRHVVAVHDIICTHAYVEGMKHQ